MLAPAADRCVRQRTEGYGAPSAGKEERMLGDVGEFAKSVAMHWGSWLTGGLIIAAIWVYEHFKGEALPWRFAAVVLALCFLIATFMTWREQHRGWIEERQYRSRVADEFAQLRHSAQKRYYEWWESCSDPVAGATAKKAAEEMRVSIVDKLQKEISLAQADYFNTPRMFEPFPANRTLIQCPEAALINEFGYRLQRLGEIIQRILSQKPLGA